jgi:hypothetical protein
MYGKKSYAMGGVTDPKKKTISVHEQGIVDQGDGFIVYEDAGGKRLRVSVPKGFTVSANKTYSAVMDGDGYRLELEDNQFGPKDPPGQRGDMFKDGGYMKFMEGGLEAALKKKSNDNNDGRSYAGQYFSPVASDKDFRDYVLYLPDYEGNILEMTDMDFKELEDAGAKRIYLPTGSRGETANKRIPLSNVNGRDMLSDEDFKVSEIGGRSVLTPMGNFQEGGVVGDPKPPRFIRKDPNFSGVRFIGKGKESEYNKASGRGGFDFRYDLDGVKFYGNDDDGLVFIDKSGNAFSAERDYKTGNPDDEFDGYDDVFNYLKSKGAKYSQEYEDKVRAATDILQNDPSMQPKFAEPLKLNEGEEGKFQGGGMMGAPKGQGDPKLKLPRESEGEVQQEEDGREYVMYRDGTGNLVKVFGSWNEAPNVSERDEQGMGQFMAIDKSFDYPIAFDQESGEYRLDEATMDGPDDGPRGLKASPVGHLLSQMSKMGPQTFKKKDGTSVNYQGREYGDFTPGVMRGMREYKRGGKFPDLNKDGKITMADILRGRGVIPRR